MDAYPKQYLYRRVVRAKLHIDTTFASDIYLDNIAGEACFSKFHFTRLFKAVYGRTPHQYLIHVRIENARLMLASGDTVAKTCYAVGFDSITSFTGLFKRRVGQTPATYQRDQLRKDAEIKVKPLNFVPNCFVEKRGWNE